MSEDKSYRINPKIRKLVDLLMSWGMSHDEATHIVMDKWWMELPLDLRVTNPEVDDLV